MSQRSGVCIGHVTLEVVANGDSLCHLERAPSSPSLATRPKVAPTHTFTKGSSAASFSRARSGKDPGLMIRPAADHAPATTLIHPTIALSGDPVRWRIKKPPVPTQSSKTGARSRPSTVDVPSSIVLPRRNENVQLDTRRPTTTASLHCSHTTSLWREQPSTFGDAAHTGAPVLSGIHTTTTTTSTTATATTTTSSIDDNNGGLFNNEEGNHRERIVGSDSNRCKKNSSANNALRAQSATATHARPAPAARSARPGTALEHGSPPPQLFPLRSPTDGQWRPSTGYYSNPTFASSAQPSQSSPRLRPARGYSRPGSAFAVHASLDANPVEWFRSPSTATSADITADDGSKPRGRSTLNTSPLRIRPSTGDQMRRSASTPTLVRWTPPSSTAPSFVRQPPLDPEELLTNIALWGTKQSPTATLGYAFAPFKTLNEGVPQRRPSELSAYADISLVPHSQQYGNGVIRQRGAFAGRSWGGTASFPAPAEQNLNRSIALDRAHDKARQEEQRRVQATNLFSDEPPSHDLMYASGTASTNTELRGEAGMGWHKEQADYLDTFNSSRMAQHERREVRHREEVLSRSLGREKRIRARTGNVRISQQPTALPLDGQYFRPWTANSSAPEELLD